VPRKGQQLKRFNTAIIVPGILVACSAVLALAAGSVAPAAAVPRAQAKDAASQMPDGAGKKIIVEKCQVCHSLERIVTSRREKDDWQAVIDLMVEEGATLTDDEAKTVVNYLAANYGPNGPSAAAPVTAAAAPPASASAPSTIVDPDQTQFATPPDSMGLPSTVQMSMISGDFTKPGLFSALMKLPADQKIDPHSQSVDLNLVVLRGVYEVGNGDTYDAGKLQPLNAGEVVRFPAQLRHFGHARGATVILVYGVGPVSMSWGSK
jgi:cytochrome c5/quercetin dioxygenase-like cupin family protein